MQQLKGLRCPIVPSSQPSSQFPRPLGQRDAEGPYSSNLRRARDGRAGLGTSQGRRSLYQVRRSLVFVYSRPALRPRRPATQALVVQRCILHRCASFSVWLHRLSVLIVGFCGRARVSARVSRPRRMVVHHCLLRGRRNEPSRLVAAALPNKAQPEPLPRGVPLFSRSWHTKFRLLTSPCARRRVFSLAGPS